MIGEKASEDLFIMDIEGDASIPKKFLKGSKPLKADEIIAQRSAVEPVAIRKHLLSGSKTTDGLETAKRQRVSYVSHKELTRLRNLIAGKQPEHMAVEDAIFDPWSEKDDAQKLVEDPRFSFLPKSNKVQKKLAPKTLTQKPVPLTASGKQIPAVFKPSGGFSYNPVYTEYEERLITAGERELEAEKRRQAQAEKERERAEASAKSAKEAEAAEAKAEMSEWDEESAWEGMESGAEDTVLKQKRPERKTLVQRNKIKRRKEEERKQKMAQEIKKRNEQAQHIKAIAKSIEEQEAARKMALEISGEVDEEMQSEGEELELRKRKLGKAKIPNKDLELVLPDELAESLRLLKPEGNALKERYRSLLIRGKVEGTRRVPYKKRRKQDITEKWTHKDFNLF